jgi:uroporphyrinogen-III synthase
MKAIKELKIEITILQNKKIGVVGAKTAEEAKKYKLPVHFMPAQFTTDNLAREIPDIKGKKILLPRSTIANPALTKQLEAKGAFVTNIPMYETTYSTGQNKAFEKLVQNKQIICITFTSPSTVDGFMHSLQNEQIEEKVLSLSILSIGPVTTKAAKQYGFKKIYAAESYTIEGMITKLQESILYPSAFKI